MVFLSLSCWVRNRGPDRYCAGSGGALNMPGIFVEGKIAASAWPSEVFTELLYMPQKQGKAKARHMRKLWISRIAGACQEHGLKYPNLIHNLVKTQVALNRKVVSDFAIYEPKTFKSLAALAKRRREEGFLAALGDGKEPEGIFSRVVQHH